MGRRPPRLRRGPRQLERRGLPPLRAGRPLSAASTTVAATAARPASGSAAKRCACTGLRWCARCRDPLFRRAHGLREPLALPEWLGRDPERTHAFDPARQEAAGCPAFRGVRVYPDALSAREADAILRTIEASAFVPSQSGKRKQHFGPRVNFARRRLNADRFSGLPAYAHFLERRLRERVLDDRAGGADDLADCRAALDAYRTTDVFVLRYAEAEQSNLDLHVDDLFAYGEAILDVSLDADGVLTFLGAEACVRVPLPARSIAVLYGPARRSWQHGILAPDVRDVRTSVTLRTLAPALHATEFGRRVLALAAPPDASAP